MGIHPDTKGHICVFPSFSFYISLSLSLEREIERPLYAYAQEPMDLCWSAFAFPTATVCGVKSWKPKNFCSKFPILPHLHQRPSDELPSRFPALVCFFPSRAIMPFLRPYASRQNCERPSDDNEHILPCLFAHLAVGQYYKGYPKMLEISNTWQGQAQHIYALAPVPLGRSAIPPNSHPQQLCICVSFTIPQMHQALWIHLRDIKELVFEAMLA